MEHCSALRLSLCILLVLNMTQPVARAAADTLDPAVYARAEALLGPNLARQVQAVYASEMAPDGGSGVASRGGNLWLVPAADTGAARALTTDGALIAGYGVWPDNWQANLIPRERAQRLTPPVETYWAPNSRIVLVSYTDQQQIAPYPYIESAPRDGSFRPRVHPIRIPLVGEHSARFEWYLIDTDTGARQRVDLPYAQLLALEQDMTDSQGWISWWPMALQIPTSSALPAAAMVAR